MKKSIYLWVSLGISALLVSGCGKKYPDDILQPAQMEELLHDYHLASFMSNELPYSENYKKQAYLNYVFKKHNVTEAQFDSSMVWYARHTEELAKIYDNLNKRFDRESKLVASQVAKRDNQTFVSLSGDTVNIWQDRPVYWLTASPVTNRMTFDFKADTTFKPKDTFVWEADYNFLPSGTRAEVIVGLTVSFANDSVQGVTGRMTGAGTQRFYLKADSASIRGVNGFIYFKADTLHPSSVLISNIRLTRIHDKVGGKLSNRTGEVLDKNSINQNPDKESAVKSSARIMKNESR